MSKLIVHLGGGLDRADKCIELANQYPEVPILVASELNRTISDQVINYYTDRGIPKERVFLDYASWDTLTNFTHTLKRVNEEFKADEVYVVTYDYHMRRAMLIANAVYWRRGITPIPCKAGGPDPYGNFEEPINNVRDDAIRAWVWRLTGLLFYWKKVREDRPFIGSPVQWNEIGL